MGTSRRRFTAEFKTKVVLEALKQHLSSTDLALKFEVHPAQITEWKKKFLENSSTVFDKGSSESKKEDTEKQIYTLYSQIGQLMWRMIG